MTQPDRKAWGAVLDSMRSSEISQSQAVRQMKPGVYLARFTATDGSGMVKHAAVSKLVVMK